MAIEIKEIIIRATVDSGESGDGGMDVEKDGDLLNEAVEETLNVLKRKKER